MVHAGPASGGALVPLLDPEPVPALGSLVIVDPELLAALDPLPPLAPELWPLGAECPPVVESGPPPSSANRSLRRPVSSKVSQPPSA
jgi:hypothetical protein